MDLTFIKEIINPYLEKNNLYLYDIKEGRLDGNLEISVFIDKQGGITIDELASCNDYLSNKLDELYPDFINYYLEVSSPGAERDIRNYDELLMAKGAYIYLEKNGQKYIGDLVDVIDDTIVLKVNLKGRFKNMEFKYSEINKIHYQVKF